MQTRIIQTRSMVKKAKFNNAINTLPEDVEGEILLYFRDELILNWSDVIQKEDYKKFKNYMNNGMGIGFKSEKLIRKFYIQWLKSNKIECNK